ncbi:hypothetical protein L208DRAFT_1375807 [Tricholoma matsutake]|nr:hypothetical protein L208DRAFT_1375807 [Tricholoma matsutake 945]
MAINIIQGDHDACSLNHIMAVPSEASEVGEGPETENGVAVNLITLGAADWDNTFKINNQLKISDDLATRLEINTTNTLSSAWLVPHNSTLLPMVSVSPASPSAPLSASHSSMLLLMASASVVPSSPTSALVNDLSQMAHGPTPAPHLMSVLPQVSALLAMAPASLAPSSPTSAASMNDLPKVSQTHDGHLANVTSILPIPLQASVLQTGSASPVPSLSTAPVVNLNKLPIALQTAATVDTDVSLSAKDPGKAIGDA